MKKKTKKVNHDYVCDVCSKPATINIQSWVHKYTIENDGTMVETDDWEGGENEFYCDKHDQ